MYFFTECRDSSVASGQAFYDWAKCEKSVCTANKPLAVTYGYVYYNFAFLCFYSSYLLSKLRGKKYYYVKAFAL